jgi:hypothetical protein
MVFFSSGFHKKTVKELLVVPFGSLHLIFVKQFYKLEDFPFEEAITLWGNMKTRYCIDS